MMGADDDAVIERVLFWKGKNRVLLYEAMTLVEVELRAWGDLYGNTWAVFFLRGLYV